MYKNSLEIFTVVCEYNDAGRNFEFITKKLLELEKILIEPASFSEHLGAW